MNIKKGDLVFIMSGDDRGKTAKVIQAMPKEMKILVDGINTVKRHEKPRKEGAKGQVVERAMPISVSKVRLADKVKEKKEVKEVKEVKAVKAPKAEEKKAEKKSAKATK